MTASVVYSLGEDSVELPVFTNIYKTADLEITLEALKTLTGKILEDGEFTFVLTDENGNTVEVTNAADGTIRFSGITYTEAGVYTYTLSEVNDAVEYMTYDETVHTIVITVIDNGDGQLVAETVTVDTQTFTVTGNVIDTGVEFVNSYDWIPETGDSLIGIATFMMGASFSALAVLLLARKRRRYHN